MKNRLPALPSHCTLSYFLTSKVVLKIFIICQSKKRKINTGFYGLTLCGVNLSVFQTPDAFTSAKKKKKKSKKKLLSTKIMDTNNGLQVANTKRKSTLNYEKGTREKRSLPDDHIVVKRLRTKRGALSISRNSKQLKKGQKPNYN